MGVAPEHVAADLVAEDGTSLGEITQFVTVKDGAARWLEVTGRLADGRRFTGRIPIAEGWTLVRLHGH